MTDVIGSASIEVRAKLDRLNTDARKAERDMKASVGRIERDYATGGRRATDAWGRSQRQMVQQTKRAEAEIRASSARIQSAVSGAAGALAAAGGTGALIQLSDAYTRFSNSLKVAGLEGASLGDVQERLFAIAMQSGVEVEALGQLYSRAAQSAGELGATQGQLIQFSSGVSAALRIQGADAGAASGALLQLSQALAAGTVRAEEFNSINEGARPILEAVANGSDRFGGSVAKLRAEVLAGTVTSKEFFDAFLKGSGDLEKKAGQTTLTVAQGFTNLQTALIQYVGQSDAANATTAALSGALQLMAENLDLLIPSIAAIAVGIGTAYVGGAVAATAATGGLSAALGVLNGAMLVVSRHPIIAALTVIAAGLAFVAVRGNDASNSTQALARSTDTARDALARYEQAAILAANAAGENARMARVNAEEMRKEALAALASARAQAARARAMAKTAATEAQVMRNSRGERALNARGAGTTNRVYDRRAEDAALNARAADLAVFALEGELAVIESRIADSRQSAGGGAVLSTPRSAGAVPRASAARDKASKPLERKVRELLADLEKQRDAEFADYIDSIRGVLTGKQADLAKSRARDVQKAAQDAADATEASHQRMRDNFRSAFSEGMRAALEGDVAGLFESLAGRFTDRMLDNLADSLFDLLSSAKGGGSGWIGTAISAIFGGGRAFGGPVGPSQIYKVGERGPEYFVPPGAGQIVPNGGMKGGAGERPVRVQVDVSASEYFDARVREVSTPVAEGAAGRMGRRVMDASRRSAPGLQQRQNLLGTT